MKQLFFGFVLLLFCFDALASDTTNIPISRISRHEEIRAEQILCDKMDGKVDGMLRVGGDEKINKEVTNAYLVKPNEFRQWIETNDKDLPTNNDKIRNLRYVSKVLSNFRIAYRAGQIQKTELPALLANFDKIMKAKAAGQSALSFFEEGSYAIAKINAQVFADDAEANAAATIVYLKFTKLYPNKILQTIAPFAKETFADSLIVVACKANPEMLYSFAGSPNSEVGKLIFRNENKMVKQIAILSQKQNALLYFPFLDDIISERQSIANIKKYVGDGDIGYDSLGYYKLLVRTATAYSRRMAAPLKDTAVAYYGSNGLLKTLYKKAYEHFVKHINELHDQSNLAIRMKAIQPLTAVELYYMMVMCESDIYTSSYKHSFNRMMQLMGAKPRGDSLLLQVNFDHFRKFIKMAANYNKLDTFLKTMPNGNSELLMKAFVANLDQNNLEDAVDVADSYSSITNKKLQQSMLQNVVINEATAVANNIENGKIIYGLLKTIFLSADDSNKIDLTKELGIPPIFDVANKYMRNDKAAIVEQVFFYGDKDGKTFYTPFRNSFLPTEWKVTEKKEWIEAISLKGNVMLFANKPLDNDANLDDTAQIHLGIFLKEQGLTPSLIVHRGHSYWLPRTMDRMPGEAKIVLLGSCGGYQNLNKILELNPDAHIISTKEIGAGDINKPILSYMNQVFTSGADLSWRSMWQNLSKTFSKDPNKAIRDSWESYIPPYKNLGAIFLKAYSIKVNAQ
jgi:hypothetical protein